MWVLILYPASGPCFTITGFTTKDYAWNEGLRLTRRNPFIIDFQTVEVK